MKFIYYAVILICASLIVAMCSVNNDDRRGGRNFIPIDSSTDKKKQEESDPRKQVSCQTLGSGGSCEGDDDCEDICDDIFDSRGDRGDCEELNVGLVEDFEDLIEDLEDGEVDVDLDVLECLIDIDEEPIADAVSEMSTDEALEFLAEIAEDSDLAEILEEEDGGMVLGNLFKEAGYNNLQDILGERDEDENFLYLIGAENNEVAFDYFEDYVEDECDDEDANDRNCPKGEPIRAYCRGFLNWNDDDVEDFIEDSDAFADEYEDTVQDADYSYEVGDFDDDDEKGDFLDFCRVASNINSQVAFDGSCRSTIGNPDLSVGRLSFGSGNTLYSSSIGSVSPDVDLAAIDIRQIVFSTNVCANNCAGRAGFKITTSEDLDVLYLGNSVETATKYDRCASVGNVHSFCVSRASSDFRGNDWYVYLAKEESNSCTFSVPVGRDLDVFNL